MYNCGISEISCCKCGGEVNEFVVPNELWNIVMRPDGHETNQEYLCFDCWNKKLFKFIINLLYPKCTCEKCTGMKPIESYYEDIV